MGCACMCVHGGRGDRDRFNSQAKLEITHFLGEKKGLSFAEVDKALHITKEKAGHLPFLPPSTSPSFPLPLLSFLPFFKANSLLWAESRGFLGSSLGRIPSYPPLHIHPPGPRLGGTVVRLLWPHLPPLCRVLPTEARSLLKPCASTDTSQG